MAASSRQLSAHRSSEGFQGASLERVASWLSAACAVHCLVFPAASALVPLVGLSGQVTAFGRYEAWLHPVVVVGGLMSLVIGYRRHRELRIVAVMVLCIALYLLGHAAEGAWYGVLVSVLGGFGLAAASFWSARRGHVHLESCEH